MKNNNNLTSASVSTKRNRHDDSTKIAMMANDNMKKYIVIETGKECDANTAKKIRKALSSANMQIFDIEINNNGLTTNLIGVITTSHDKALKIVLDYLGDGMPSFEEIHESGMTCDLGYNKRWRIDDITITSNEGVISRFSETVIVDSCTANNQ